MRLATTHTYQTPTVRERVRCGHRVHVGPCASCQQAAYDRQAAQLADAVAAGSPGSCDSKGPGHSGNRPRS
jgi:hypothetical protein